jgi:hypothetical protein
MGTLLVESRRHFLHFGEMRAAEAVELASILRAVFPAIERAVGGERLYSIALMDAVPHFHLWRVPKPKRSRMTGVRYLALDHRPLSGRRVTSSVRRIRHALTDPSNAPGHS